MKIEAAVVREGKGDFKIETLELAEPSDDQSLAMKARVW